MLIRTAPPAIKDPVEFNVQLPPCNIHKLSNGVEVYALNMGSEDTMMISWTFYAGNCFEKKKGSSGALLVDRGQPIRISRLVVTL